MLWRSCLLVIGMNGPKYILFGFVVLRLSYIIIIYFLLPCHLSSPNAKYSRKKTSKIPVSTWIVLWKFWLKVVTFSFSLGHFRKLYKKLKLKKMEDLERADRYGSSKHKESFRSCSTHFFKLSFKKYSVNFQLPDTWESQHVDALKLSLDFLTDIQRLLLPCWLLLFQPCQRCVHSPASPPNSHLHPHLYFMASEKGNHWNEPTVKNHLPELCSFLGSLGD